MDGRVVLIDSEVLTLWHLPAEGMLWHQIHRWTCGEPFRALLETGLGCIREHGVSKWLSDNRNNNALPPDDERWIHGDWFPRCMESGWRHWAIVPPEKVFGRKNMSRYASRYETYGLKTAMFATPQQALHWLRQR